MIDRLIQTMDLLFPSAALGGATFLRFSPAILVLVSSAFLEFLLHPLQVPFKALL